MSHHHLVDMAVIKHEKWLADRRDRDERLDWLRVPVVKPSKLMMEVIVVAGTMTRIAAGVHASYDHVVLADHPPRKVFVQKEKKICLFQFSEIGDLTFE